VIVETDSQTGRAVDIERLSLGVDELAEIGVPHLQSAS
jgi:hypothetical protein